MEKKIYCGIDYHKNTATICALSQEGKEEMPVTTVKSERLIQFLSNKKNWKIGIEASGGVNEVAKNIREIGLEVVVINSNKFRAIGVGGKKTDARDARVIADCLRLNYVPEVHQKSQRSREIKSLLVNREMMVRTRVNMTNHIRGTLREYGITICQGKENFFAEIEGAIEELPQPLIASGLKQMLAMVNTFIEQEKAFDESLVVMAGEDEKVKRLQTVPGIGILTAVAMVAIVDDISRFKTAKEFGSYLGLVPTVAASADMRMMGSITRSGPEILRRYLVHGARAWMRYSPKNDANRAWAERVKERRGMNKAVVALAHRMARIAYAILRDASNYRIAA